MSSTRKLAIAFLVLALAAPAAGGAAEDPRSRRPHPRAARTLELLEGISKPDLRIRSDRKGVEVAAEPFRAIMARHLRTREAAMDTDTYLAVVHDALEAMGVPLIRGGGALDEEPADAELRFGMAGGDLDGDGDGDVIELYSRFDLQSGALLESLVIARDGEDGSALWSRALRTPDALVAAPGDITGDGVADVLVIELIVEEVSGDGACNDEPPVCAGAFTVDFTWATDVLSGDTGARRWGARYPGRVLEGVLETFSAYEQLSAAGIGAVVTATNAFLLPMISGDHDGDGGSDIIMVAIDFAEVFALAFGGTEQAGVFGYGDIVLTATKSAVLDGTDGAALYRRTMQPHPGVALLWSPGDAVGDETPDLLWEHAVFVGPAGGCVYATDVFQCAEVGASDLTAEMIDGATFQRTWTSGPYAPALAAYFLPVGDADGDGKDDLVLIDYTAGYSSVVISGASGSELWRYEGFILGALGEADGVPLVVAIEEEYDVPGLAFSLVRLNGANGAEVGRTRHEAIAPGDWWEVFFLIELWLLPDSDADGVLDPFVQISAYAGPATSIDTSLESGASMETLFTRHADREFFGIPVVDLNGDGITDMVDLDIEFHRKSLDLGLGGTTLPDGESLWAGEIRLFPFVFGAIESGGDLDGDGADEVLVSLFQETPSGYEAAIRAISGANGVGLWQLGDLSEPPLPATASISGTITGDGAPFSGACVHLFDTDFNYLGTSIANGSGAYTIVELDPGSYKLEFGSCSFFPFAFEWYDDQPDFESANVIEVSEGETITGIDADLAPFVWEE